MINHYYPDGTLYLGVKTELDGVVKTEAGVELMTFAALDRYPKIFAKSYWPHSILPYPARCYPVKAAKAWAYTPESWRLSKGQLNEWTYHQDQ